MTTYAQLQQDIREWTLYDDIPVKRFIQLCEHELSRSLRLDAQVVSTPLTINARTEDAPLDMLEAISLSLDADGQTLDYLPPVQIKKIRGYSRQGIPEVFTVEGHSFLFAPEPSDDNAATLVYYQKFEPLSDTNTTNWLLQNAYDLYLYGSLIHAGPYVKDTSMVQLWIAGYDRAIESVRRQNQRKSVKGANYKRINGDSP